MLDFFAIFSKGGIVLWCFQTGSFTSPVNALIKSVILQERVGNAPFSYDGRCMQYFMDNEFELVFVVGYQSFVQLSYVDKVLSTLALQFRDKYKNDLTERQICRDFSSFENCYQTTTKQLEQVTREEAKKPKPMRQYTESEKSKKTVASMIISKPGDTNIKAGKCKKPTGENGVNVDAVKVIEKLETAVKENGENGVVLDSDTIVRNRQKMAAKMKGAPKKGKETKQDDSPPKLTPRGKQKEKRRWDTGATGEEAKALDYGCAVPPPDAQVSSSEGRELVELRGTLRGELSDIHVSEDEGSSESEEEEEQQQQEQQKQQQEQKKGGMFSLLRNLVTAAGGQKTLSRTDMVPVLERLKDRLIGKNVAVEIATKLCDSVATRLEGVQLGTFERVAGRVQSAMEEACTQLLASRRRLDVLRDVLEAKKAGRPYVIVFCGVNGVGKSTNLAKIAFWLMEKEHRVLIAACDTFRAGAVEQLRTHVRKLNYIHPPEMYGGRNIVELYEKGYGRDSAAIAMAAINAARDQHFDVVLVDTAGRMQDNEPLMRSLAKLIVTNNPDLVLFVGEALVGNEAVDQLVKFNQALADHSQTDQPHTLDGIVLTKFDTVDDKVGAAISMAYISGQPIVFVGTGQTYADLRQLSATAVVKALMK